MPWEEKRPQSLRPESENPIRQDRSRGPSGRSPLSSLHPGHRPSASALGSILPTRWAGREPNAFQGWCSYSVTSPWRQVGRTPSSNPPRGAMPFSDGSQSRRWVPPFQGGWDCGTAYLALKRQAIQSSPFQGEPPRRDEPRAFRPPLHESGPVSSREGGGSRAGRLHPRGVPGEKRGILFSPRKIPGGWLAGAGECPNGAGG